MHGFTSTLAAIWRLTIPYFRSEDRWPGRILLASVVAIELALVGITYLLSVWNERFYNALQDRNWDAFVSELLYFCALTAASIGLAVYQLYLNQWLQIRWRRWFTNHYLDKWPSDSNHYRMQLLGDAADNPDQRISEDIKMFIDRTLYIGLGLLNATMTLAALTVRLWALSAAAPLHLFGAELMIPGYLVWVALIYAVIGTAFTHWIGWPLVSLIFNQQRYEADFRFNLVRVRENSEQIALLAGERVEKRRLGERFDRLVGNWLSIMQRTKKLTFFTASYSQVSIIFPYVVVSPAYFAGKSADFAEDKQLEYHQGNWEDILYNSAGSGEGNSIGGTVFEFVDEWWKSGLPPKFSPSEHETVGDFVAAFPDGWMHEEWLGVTSQGDGSYSPFMRQPRKVYDYYKKVWNQK